MNDLLAFLNYLRQRFQRWHSPESDVKLLLRQAAEYLPADVVAAPDVSRATFHDFQEFLAQHEFELAMEVLEELASGTQPAAAFWGLLAEAAERMNCAVQQQRYRDYSQVS
jgi:hypothetical protein